MIWLIITVCVLLLLFITYTVVFIAIFGKRKSNDITQIGLSQNSRFGKHAKAILEGRKWLENRKAEDVYITANGGIRLYARFFPTNSNKVFILFHGYHSFGDNDFSCALEAYHNKGFNILLVDQRAHGKSGGKIVTFGIKERYDCKCWIDYAVNRMGKDCEIFLGGMSMGTSTVLMALELDLPKNIKGVTADCGFTSPAEIISAVAKRIKIPPFLFIKPLNLFCRLYGRFSMYETSTVKALKNNTIPVLFIHGDEDGLVPYEMTKENFNACKGPKKLVIVKGADHGLSYLIDKKTVGKALDNFINNPDKAGIEY